MSGEVKTCTQCQVEKPLSHFHKDGRKCGSLRSRCKACIHEYTKAQRIRNPKPYRNAQLRQYGITSDQYEELERQQGGVCYVCRQPQQRGRTKYLCVDHCHRTGKVRKLLCHRCNAALGYANDDPGRLRQLADYLEEP